MKTFETNGYFYEDLNVGTAINHDHGRTVTQIDNKLVGELTAFNHPLHTDVTYAETTEFGNITLSGIGTFSIVYGLSSSLLSINAITNLEWANVKFLNPVYIGDTLYAKSEILFKRESKSRPTQGIIHIKTIGLNQHNNLVISFERVFLIKRRYIPFTF
jgi:itaconyl-CoA hydratase